MRRAAANRACAHRVFIVRALLAYAARSFTLHYVVIPSTLMRAHPCIYVPVCVYTCAPDTRAARSDIPFGNLAWGRRWGGNVRSSLARDAMCANEYWLEIEFFGGACSF